MKKKKMTSKDIRAQREIINEWVDDCANAYNIHVNNVTYAHIVAYLAQVRLGYHR